MRMRIRCRTETVLKNYLIKKLCVCMYVLPIYIYVPCASLVLTEARKSVKYPVVSNHKGTGNRTSGLWKSSPNPYYFNHNCKSFL